VDVDEFVFDLDLDLDRDRVLVVFDLDRGDRSMSPLPCRNDRGSFPGCRGGGAVLEACSRRGIDGGSGRALP
jgi:hypothetical protein